MKFNIDFDERALKEWHKLDKSIREQFKKKLRKLQENPYIESARLHGDLIWRVVSKSSCVRPVFVWSIK